LVTSPRWEREGEPRRRWLQSVHQWAVVTPFVPGDDLPYAIAPGATLVAGMYGGHEINRAASNVSTTAVRSGAENSGGRSIAGQR
jgi:hypothetical protein